MKQRKKSNSDGVQQQQEQQHHNGHLSKFRKYFDPEASWDKDQLGDVLHWARQLMALVCGLIWGAIPLVGGIWFMLRACILSMMWDENHDVPGSNTSRDKKTLGPSSHLSKSWFLALSTGLIYGYYALVLKVDEEEFGGHGALLQEGLFASVTLFLLLWTLVYSLAHF